MKDILRLLILILIAGQFWEPGEVEKPKKIECLDYNMIDDKCYLWDNE